MSVLRHTVTTVLSLCTSCNDDVPMDDFLINALLTYRGKEGLKAITLLDPGARSKSEINLIDSQTVKRLVALGAMTHVEKATVCDMHTCETYKTAVELNTKLIFDSDNGDIVDLGNLTFQIVDKLPSSEVIVGWPTLKKAKLFCRCHNSLQNRIKFEQPTEIRTLTQLKYAQSRGTQVSKQSSATEDSELSDDDFDNPYGTTSYISSIKRTHLHDLIDYEMEAAGEVEKFDALDEALQGNNSTEEFQLPSDIQGSPSLQSKIKTLLNLYSDCFRSIVSKVAAKIKPFSFKIDLDKWFSSRQNNTRYRTHSAKKHEEIDRQVKLLEDLQVIRRSRRDRYSQVHLVPKPLDLWRFCLDFRFLNSCTEMEE